MPATTLVDVFVGAFNELNIVFGATGLMAVAVLAEWKGKWSFERNKKKLFLRYLGRVKRLWSKVCTFEWHSFAKRSSFAFNSFKRCNNGKPAPISSRSGSSCMDCCGETADLA